MDDNDGVKKLTDAIDSSLPNCYVVVDGDNETLFVQHRVTKVTYEINISKVVD